MARWCNLPVILGICIVTCGFCTAVSGDVSTGDSLSPGYTPNISSGHIPLAIRFTDASAGNTITAWAWDFNNDGVVDSTDKDPVCIYTREGNYTVSLRITNASGSKTLTRTGIVMARSLAPSVSFKVENDTGVPPLVVTFTDTSTGTGITGRAWDFDNDGVIDSTDKDPVCVYTREGNYTVSLTVTNASGTNTSVREEVIRVITGMEPRFTANLTTGSAPLAIRFTDTSTGGNITGHAWDFDNDGVIDSTDKDPACVYTRKGNYTVSLTVTNASGTGRAIRPEFITVMTGMEPRFTANLTTGSAPLAIRFTDTSTGGNITGHAWDFDNDGIVDSTDPDPVCVYTRAGMYSVGLTLANPYGTDTTQKKDYIHVTSLAPVAGFGANITAGMPDLAVQFTDTSTGPAITAWAWDFDSDGVVDSTDPDPVCVYRLVGNYSVSLTVTGEHGSDTVVRRDFVSVTTGIPRARFAVNQTGGPAPLSVMFRDTSTGPDISAWAWDFDNNGVTDSTVKNPVTTYDNPGNYTIRFTVTNARGSDTIERKDFIWVT